MKLSIRKVYLVQAIQMNRYLNLKQIAIETFLLQWAG